jgi:hypothetical protein
VQPSEKKQLLSLLDALRRAVEELLLAGLTTASRSTVERMDVTFKEASRLKLLRLGSTLRIANEEISRFTRGQQQFSARRLSFFLGRTWLLAEGMRRAIEKNDDVGRSRLMATPKSEPVEKIKAVVLGVGKRVVMGAFATFEFRMRVVGDSGPVKSGAAVVWSSVFPMRGDSDLPAEAFLHLPQKQKFKPSILLEKKVIEITRCAVSQPPTASARLMLSEASEVKTLEAHTEWAPMWRWAATDAAARLGAYQPTPLDLEIELQEEVFLEGWEAGEKRSSDEGFDLLPIRAGGTGGAGGIEMEARLDRGPSGDPVNAIVSKMSAGKTRPPLFGTMHYEGCRLVFQPLSALGKDGPEYLTVSAGKISQATLLKAMKFT